MKWAMAVTTIVRAKQCIGCAEGSIISADVLRIQKWKNAPKNKSVLPKIIAINISDFAFLSVQ